MNRKMLIFAVFVGSPALISFHIQCIGRDRTAQERNLYMQLARMKNAAGLTRY